MTDRMGPFVFRHCHARQSMFAEDRPTDPLMMAAGVSIREPPRLPKVGSNVSDGKENAG
jgi:hypothetical protein